MICSKILRSRPPFMGLIISTKLTRPWRCRRTWGVRIVILCFRPASDAIGECGLQAIEVGAKNIRVSVGYESCKSLTNALTHDSRLAVMGTKAFFFQDCSHTG